MSDDKINIQTLYGICYYEQLYTREANIHTNTADIPTLENLIQGDSLSLANMVGAAGKILDFACPRSSKRAFQHPRRSNQQQELGHIMEAQNSV